MLDLSTDEFPDLDDNYEIPREMISAELCESLNFKPFKKDEFYFEKVLKKDSFSVMWSCVNLKSNELVLCQEICPYHNKSEMLEFARRQAEILSIINNHPRSSEFFAKFYGSYYKISESTVPDSEEVKTIKSFILVFEQADCTLKDLISIREDAGSTSSPYSPEEALPILSHLAQGLMILQELGIYHSDIKPNNIFFSKSKGTFFLNDFSISVKIDLYDQQLLSESEEHGINVKDYVLGLTKAFSSPEKKNLLDVDQNGTFNPNKCDVWSLGVCIERMIGKTEKSKAVSSRESEILHEILGGMKSSCWKNRYDARAICKILGDSQIIMKKPDFRRELEFLDYHELERCSNIKTINGAVKNFP